MKNTKKSFVIMHHSRNTEQKRIHDKILKDGVCPFCWEHFLKYHTKKILQKTKYWLVTENAWPYEGTSQHTLIVLKRHIEHVNKLTSTEWGDLHKCIKKFAPKDGGSFFIRFGDSDRTGASVTHLHCHIIVGEKRKSAKSKFIAVPLGYKKHTP